MFSSTLVIASVSLFSSSTTLASSAAIASLRVLSAALSSSSRLVIFVLVVSRELRMLLTTMVRFAISEVFFAIASSLSSIFSNAASRSLLRPLMVAESASICCWRLASASVIADSRPVTASSSSNLVA